MSESTPLVFYDRAMIEHDPGEGHPERPDRLRAIEAILDDHTGEAIAVESPPEATLDAIGRVHGQQHVQRMVALRDDYAMIDPDTHVSPGSIRAALMAAGAAVASVDAIFDAPPGGSTRAFAAVRPPGHHAEPDRAMGFCLFNNVAIAAAHARARHGASRVLVVDWDVHHGNGTQAAFYDDPNVLFCSVHQYPFYPGTGALSETGAGAGKGFTVNVPLPMGAGDADLRLAFDEVILPVADVFAPELVLVSAGFDAHRSDPLAGLDATAEGFADLCARVQGIADRHAKGRLALFLEGGYDLVALAESTRACLDVMAGASAPHGSPGDTAGTTLARAQAQIRAARQHHRRAWPSTLV